MAKTTQNNLPQDLVASLEAFVRNDKVLQQLYRKIQDGSANHVDANAYAQRAGALCSKAIQGRISEILPADMPLPPGEAEKALKPLLGRLHAIVDNVCRKVQASQNQKAGIGISAQSAQVDWERIEGLISYAESMDTPDQAQRAFDEPVINYAQHVVDESVRLNADFQYRSGLSPKIVRDAAGSCCDWCAALRGTYDYADVKNGSDVFRRHRGCRCTVNFVSGKTRQDVWSKKVWQASPKELEQRKTYGLPQDREPNKIEARKRNLTSGGKL